MKNKKLAVIIVSLVMLIVVLLLTEGFFLRGAGLQDADVDMSDTQNISVVDGQAEPEKYAFDLQVPKAGTYIISAKWKLERPGFITGLVVSDKQGKEVFAATAESCEMDSDSLQLEEAVYTVEFYYLSNPRVYEQFLLDREFENTEMYEDFESNGSWEWQYQIKLIKTVNMKGIAVFCGFIAGVLFTILFLALTKTDKNVKCKFDERQELVRGKGFQYGFFSMLICNVLFTCMELAEMPLFAEFEVLILISSIIGIGVCAVYCIWNEGYFALNENKKRLMILFAVISVMNFIFGGVWIYQDMVIQNGKLTYYSINLFCGLLFIIIFLTMLLKRICKDGKDE
ncbi:MAG: hypothetical protein HDR22_02165 [Lachnospiraceae bacterium]|nr:hypothetical protein [Lachnospiraceae bacterium]